LYYTKYNDDIILLQKDRVLFKDLEGIILSFIILCFFLSPLLAFYLGAIILALYSKLMGKRTRRILGFFLVLSGSLIIASREVFVSSSDDMRRYYPAFLNILENGRNVFKFGGGYEPLLGIYYKFLGMLFGRLSPNALIFFVSFLTSSIFWIWLEVYGIKYFKKEDRAFLVGVSFVFFSFGLSSQLQRQMLAFTIMLFAISIERYWKSIIIAIIASLAHITVLPIYFIIKILAKCFSLGLIIIVLIATSTVYLIKNYIFELVNLNIPITNKLSYYTVYQSGFTETDLSILPYFILIFFSILFLNGLKDFKSFWGRIFLGNFIFYLLLLPLPLLPLRISLLVSAVLTGYIIFYSIRRFKRVFLMVFIAFSIYRIIKLGFFYNYIQGFALWSIYPPFSIIPLYYLYYLF